MKKIYFFGLATTLASVSLHAQINKGALLLGGGIGFSSQKVENSSSSSTRKGVFVIPTIGIATRQNTVVGVTLGYSKDKMEYSPSPLAASSEYTRWHVGVFYRRYFTLGKNMYAFAQGDATYSRQEDVHLNFNGSNANRTGKSNSYGIFLTPGFAFAVSRRFHLELGLSNLAGLSYSHGNYEITGVIMPPAPEKTSDFSFFTRASIVNQLTVGFRVLLNKQS